MSEIAADCNVLLNTALINAEWTKCSITTRKDLCMLIRRVQCTDYLSFNGGAILTNRIFYLKLIKVAYTFVNFMKLKSSMINM
ncbi:hypothetical protein WDU94_014264 [Cyamophila willieti]